ncbi:lantibiotic dehydratase [Ktedonosporobacter rubrisoli]|nr:lantibiotic dehydratase [Ktedonosporobacter rubrisoli]
MERFNNKQPPQEEQVPLYRPMDFFMLRAPTLSLCTYQRLTSQELAGADTNHGELGKNLEAARQQTYNEISHLLTQSRIEQALLVASPSLFESLAHLQSAAPSSRRVQRTYASVLRYLVRMSTRPTPFGLFAGVAMGRFADESTAQLANPQLERTFTRPDMKWLIEFVEQIEQTQEYMQQLRVVVNQAVHIVGSRAILSFAKGNEKEQLHSIALQMNPAVSYILEHATHLIPYQQLCRELSLAFPQLNEEQMQRILRQLLAHSFLITDLKPPLTHPYPARYVLERLSSLSGARPLREALEAVLASMAELDRAVLGEASLQFQQLVAQQKQLPKGIAPIYQLDTALNVKEPYLNKAIGAAAAQAAETLLRLANSAYPISPLQQYRTLFLERYGVGTEIPVLDLLNEETGPGIPSSYHEEQGKYCWQGLSPSQAKKRNAILTAWLASAINEGALEVELNEHILSQLAPSESTLHPYEVLDIYCTVQACSREAIDNGDWRLLINNIYQGGRTFGRFLHLFNEKSMACLRKYNQQEEQLSPDAIFAELNYIFPVGHDMNMFVRPLLRSYEIAVNTMPFLEQEHVIHLSDLVVGISDCRFYLRSLRLGKKVIICQGHAHNVLRAPPLCRFLLDVSQDGRPPLLGFEWGALRMSPFLPRVVQKKVVLSPAQWRLYSSDVAENDAEDEETQWFCRIQQWRKKWRVPRYVYLVDVDQRLLLDLEHPCFLAELHRALKQARSDEGVCLQEMLPAFEHFWLRDTKNEPYASELIVPLILQRKGQISAEMMNFKEMRGQYRYPPRALNARELHILPGQEWTYLKLYSGSKRQNEIIAGPLREIVHKLGAQGLISDWFFIRYTDPQPHLRLRFHATNAQTCDQLLITTLAWGRNLVEHGLIHHLNIEGYDRETARYGGPEAIDTIERLFSANSQVVSDIIAGRYSQHITLDPFVVAVFSLDQFLASWGFSALERLNFTQAYTTQYEYREIFRPLRKSLLSLLLQEEIHQDIDVKRQKALLQAIIGGQAPVVRQAAQRIRTLVESDRLWGSESSILMSLVHMHLNRLLGAEPEQERKVYACWRHALESAQHYLQARGI